MDFLALMVIADFDNFFYAEHSSASEISKKIVELKDDEYGDMFTIQMSSSRDAQKYPPKTAAQFAAVALKPRLSAEERQTAADIYNKELLEFNKFTPLKSTAWLSSIERWAKKLDSE